MSVRGWGIVIAAVLAIGWWTTRSPGAPAAASGATVRCPAPPRVLSGDPPLQSPVPGDFREVRLAAATLQPLAGFSLEARVLSREDYRLGRESDLSPTDLALGWGRMRDDAVLARLDIDQSNRWYHYRWQGVPPIPLSEIIDSSANMHMIPGSEAIASALARVEAGERVRIDGWLVEAQAPDGWRWRSSTSREDTGAGACELVYVCAVTRL